MANVPPQLTPFKPKGDKRSDELRKKRKGSSSDKRKRAQKINAIKRMSFDTIHDKALMMVNDEQYSAVEIQKMIQEMLKRDDLKSDLKIKLIDTMIKAHSTIHGSKNKNLNMNIDITADAVVERLKNWKMTQIINNNE